MLHCKVKETPENILLNCKEYDTEQEKLENYIKEIFYKNNCPKLNINMKDLEIEIQWSNLYI